MSNPRSTSGIRGIREVEKNTGIKYHTETCPFIDWYAAVSSCSLCGLSKGNPPVPGDGNIKAKLLILGEAPGYEETQQHSPFVGRAGVLFASALKEAGFKKEREEYFISNVVKCRPTKVSDYNNICNRPPTDAEVKFCMKHTDELVNILNPQLIVCVGAPSAKAIIKPNLVITKERGITISSFRYGVPAMPVIHPSYIMRQVGDLYQSLYDQLVDDLRVVYKAIKYSDEY